ncbi:MAG TPA: hypothetical protein VER96_07310 [Polyangiaceae bacterium]|nr:hypothetical protein [Polyangiaceae bacterium]
MSVTLSEVKRAARAHRAPLAGESAGYLVLAVADQVLQAPRLVQVADVQLAEDGALRVMSARASSDEEAELSLRRTLDQLLLVASSGSAALTRASRRTAPVGLAALVRELEAALIPVNRSAARRALSRLHRETARALETGNLPPDEEEQAMVAPPAPVAAIAPPAPVAVVAAPTPVVIVAPPEPVVVLPTPEAVVVAPSQPSAPVAAPIVVELSKPTPEVEPELDPEQDLETPARIVPVTFVAPPVIGESHLDGVVTALCDALPAPPQFVESDAMTSALAVRSVLPPAVEPEPEFLLDVDVEFEAEATDAVDSSAAPTVMRAVAVEPVTLSIDDDSDDNDDSDCVTQALELPLEARTKPEPVVLRKALRPLLDLLPKPSDPEPLLETPTLGTLAAQLPVLAPEQIAEMSVAANLVRELSLNAEPSPEYTERMPEVQPLSPGVAMVESKKSDVNELLSSFQVAEPDVNQGLCRAIKEMAELDLTPAPFAALIR